MPTGHANRSCRCMPLVLGTERGAASSPLEQGGPGVCVGGGRASECKRVWQPKHVFFFGCQVSVYWAGAGCWAPLQGGDGRLQPRGRRPRGRPEPLERRHRRREPRRRRRRRRLASSRPVRESDGSVVCGPATGSKALAFAHLPGHLPLDRRRGLGGHEALRPATRPAARRRACRGGAAAVSVVGWSQLSSFSCSCSSSCCFSCSCSSSSSSSSSFPSSCSSSSSSSSSTSSSSF